MRNRLSLAPLWKGLAFASILVFTFLVWKSSPPEEFSSQARSEITKAIPADWFYRQRAFPTGKINPTAYVNAWRTRERMERDDIALRSDFARLEWELAGPTNIGGRITDIEMYPDDQQTIFAGAASGGIFKSVDTGLTWRPIFDDVPNLSIGDIALAPSNKNIMYVGTGEPNAGGGSLAYDGLGVYRSDNGGESWQSAGLQLAGSIGKVIVHPNEPERVYVAAMGELFGNSPNRGVFRTTNGGRDWEKVLFVNDSTGAIDLAIHKENPDIIYAATWERIRRPNRRNYGGEGSGIYRSNDGGDTWMELTNGLPVNPENKGRIGIAAGISEPDVLYAVYADRTGNLQGIYLSEDRGNSWEATRTTGVSATSFMWWFGKIFVHPENSNEVFVTALNMHASRNAGFSWREIFRGVHVDQHAVYIHPQNPSLVINGNDGGIYVSRDGGDNYIKSGNLPITQFYTCEIDFQRPGRLYGGTQDNGTLRLRDDDPAGWDQIYGGDGFRVLVDPDDPDYIIAESQYGNLGFSTNGGNRFSNIRIDIAGAEAANWNTPIAFDPRNSQTVYVGLRRLYRSDQRGISGSYRAISPVLSEAAGDNLVYGTITTIDISPLDSDIILAGTDDGRLWTTRDGGNNWQDASTGALPRRWVTAVIADVTDPAIVYATYSGYRYNSNQSHIFKSSDLGRTWEDISGNLPDIPVNDFLIRPGDHRLFAATDIGVFFSSDEGATWEVISGNLPNVVVTDLDYHEPTDMLVAATYGRGMYRLFLDDSVVSARAAKEDLPVPEAEVFPNPGSADTRLRFLLNRPENLAIQLFNSRGQFVRWIFQGPLGVGEHLLELGSQGLPPGVYLIGIRSLDGRFLKSVKVIRH